MTIDPKAVLDHIDADELVKVTLDLANLDSPTGSEGPVADYVHDWLVRSKIFVLASDSEGLSLAVMEAMICGLPAVVSSTGDLGDLVEDGVNGRLIAERTPAAFADAMVALIADEGRRSRFSEAARRAASRYDMRSVARLWDEVLAAQGASDRRTAA